MLSPFGRLYSLLNVKGTELKVCSMTITADPVPPKELEGLSPQLIHSTGIAHMRKNILWNLDDIINKKR